MYFTEFTHEVKLEYRPNGQTNAMMSAILGDKVTAGNLQKLSCEVNENTVIGFLIDSDHDAFSECERVKELMRRVWKTKPIDSLDEPVLEDVRGLF